MLIQGSHFYAFLLKCLPSLVTIIVFLSILFVTLFFIGISSTIINFLGLEHISFISFKVTVFSFGSKSKL